LASNLAESVAAARADEMIVRILGEDAVDDYTAPAICEWQALPSAVNDRDRVRYVSLT
jgi:hypothetical protein